MNSQNSIEEFKSSYPKEWNSIKSLYLSLKYRKYALRAGIALILIALLTFFLIENWQWEIALIPGILGMACLYYALFKVQKLNIINNSIAAIFIPLNIYIQNWNIEYELTRKPYLKEFKSSRLYPYTLSQISGTHFFSGIAKKLPFIAWFVEANYRGKVLESPLSMVSSSSNFNGFLGFQIMVKNLLPHLNGVVIIQNSELEEVKEVANFYSGDDGWKELRTDDIELRKQFKFYTPIENPAEMLDESIVKKVHQIRPMSNLPFAISYRKGHVYLNQFWSEDFVNIDSNKTLRSNLELISKGLNELVEMSFVLGLPSR